MTTLLLALAAGCDEPSPPPPAIVGEHDAFNERSLRPLHADAEHLYFFSGTDLGSPAPGPDPGVYRLALAGGEPTLLVATQAVLGVERSGADLLLVTRVGSAAQLVTVPLDGSAPVMVPLTDPTSMAATSSSGATFVLAGGPDVNRRSITRLASESAPEQVFAVRAPAYVDGYDFLALDGDLYWMEGEEGLTMRIADDLSQVAPETLQPPLGGIPTTGDEEYEWSRLLGTIDGVLYGSVYVQSFFETGGTYSNGDPEGVSGFGGGGIYTLAADAADARIVAVDIVQAVIVGDTIYGQDRAGDMVQIDPATGATTKLAGHAPNLDRRPVANGENLFYADHEQLGYQKVMNAIRIVSLAPRD